MMADFWPTEKGKESAETQKFMNETPKVVISKSLEEAAWGKTVILNENIESEIKKLKNQSGNYIALLGSNQLAVSLLEMNLLDEVRLMVNPVAIGKGTPLFKGLKKKMKFELLEKRKFANDNVLLTYKPLYKVLV